MPGQPYWISPAEQAQMLAALRRARYGFSWRYTCYCCVRPAVPHVYCGLLFCSRSSVYRIVRLYHAGQLGFTVDRDGLLAAPVNLQLHVLPWIRRSVEALLKAPP